MIFLKSIFHENTVPEGLNSKICVSAPLVFMSISGVSSALDRNFVEQ